MSDPFARLSDDARDALREAALPDWTSPMLARLHHDPFFEDGWLFERKFDGERALAWRDGGSVRLTTRNRKVINDTYPELVEALEELPGGDFIVDGEIVAFEGATTSFARLQKRMQIADPKEARNSGVAVHYYLFDVLHLDGRAVDGLPLHARKKLLRAAFPFSGPIRFSAHRVRDGAAYYREACRKGWEGLIAKRADAPYRHARSGDWLKFKCDHGQELVIGGFTPPKGSREGFGALLVGYFDGDRLRYAGKVGTGFDHDTLEDLHERMLARRQDEPPFDDPPSERGITWVRPQLVGAFAFTEWTRDGKLRHPRFLGLRRDKEAADVRREDLEALHG